MKTLVSSTEHSFREQNTSNGIHFEPQTPFSHTKMPPDLIKYIICPALFLKNLGNVNEITFKCITIINFMSF